MSAVLTPTTFALRDTAGGMCCENIYTYDQQEKETKKEISHQPFRSQYPHKVPAEDMMLLSQQPMVAAVTGLCGFLTAIKSDLPGEV